MDIDATIARFGVAVQSVLTDHPYDPPFAYTIGRHLRGDRHLPAPELREVAQIWWDLDVDPVVVWDADGVVYDLDE